MGAADATRTAGEGHAPFAAPAAPTCAPRGTGYSAGMPVDTVERHGLLSCATRASRRNAADSMPAGFFIHFIESIVTHKNRFSDKEGMHITAGRFRWRSWCSWPAGH